jgi:capsid portal protein
MTADGEVVIFKEYGDPRAVSSVTGKAYDTEEALKKAEPTSKPATEILWFGGYYPEGAYPQPRWHGLTPAVIGSREAHEENARYLSGSAIPTGLLLIGDGKIGSTSQDNLSGMFDTEKGTARHKIALIEAQAPPEKSLLSGTGKVSLQWVSLREAQHDDVTFSKYIAQVSALVGETFRLPDLLRGRVEGLNRATAQAALEFAEDQVFAPERDEFDYLINSTLVATWGIRFWRFRSLGSQKRDPEVVAKMAKDFVASGIVKPVELRPLAERLMGIELPAGASDWQHQPPAFTLAGIMPPGAQAPVTVKPSGGDEGEGGEGEEGGPPPVPAPASEQEIQKRIIQLEAVLAAQRAAQVMASMQDWEGLDG